MGIEYLFMALIGGVASVWGALLGAGVLTMLKQWLQDLLPQLLGNTGNYEVIVFGIAIVLLMQRAPGGLWPTADPAAAGQLEAAPRHTAHRRRQRAATA
jgi:branched-chain amino acid transport system permease protein